jgi:hypothetical protein
VQLEETSRFSDDIWDLTPALLQHHSHAMILNFATIPAPYRLPAKQLCHRLLSGPHPDGERPYGIGTIRNLVSRLRRFFLWLAEHMPRRCLADLTTADLCRYNRALAASPLTPLAAGNVRSTIGLL